MTLRRYATLLFALGGAIALMTMHGATAHPLELPEPAATSGTMADSLAGAHAHAMHDHDRGQPCEACDHGNGGLCALIVLGIAIALRPTSATLSYPATADLCPPRRNWSPDPPVPKLGLVDPST